MTTPLPLARASTPRILALEFSSDRRSVALVQGGAVLAESVQESGRSTRVFSLIDDTLQRAGMTPADVDVVAVGIGPGSYTGIRLAISVAQGWCLATEGNRSVGVIAVNSFEVLAAAVVGSAWLVSDAQREEWAVARVEEGQITGAARLLPLGEVRALAAAARVVGPDVVRARGVGETEFPTAGRLGLIAGTRTETVAPELLEAVYLRSAAFVKAPRPRIVPGITDVGTP